MKKGLFYNPLGGNPSWRMKSPREIFGTKKDIDSIVGRRREEPEEESEEEYIEEPEDTEEEED